MSTFASPPPDRQVATPTQGPGRRHRSRLRAVVVVAVVAGLAGVGVTFAVASEPATTGRPAASAPSDRHEHRTAEHAPAATTAALDHGPADAEHRAVARRTRVGRDLVTALLATARFHRVATAERAGYARLPSPAPLHECIDEDIDLDDTDGAPAMGIHWVNGALLDGTLDVRKPEVLVYEPRANGRLDLVAVEYVVFASDWAGSRPPELYGRQLHHFPAPNRYDLPSFYALHAWIWAPNPDGLFANMNPKVTCANAGAVS